MEKGSMIRMRIGMDAHGQGGFLVMGRLIDENSNYFAMIPEAIIVGKKEVGVLEELSEGTQIDDALRTVSVGRESYLGRTTPFVIQKLELREIE